MKYDQIYVLRFEVSIFKKHLYYIDMNSEIILRLRSPEGQNRISSRAGDTFGEFMMKVIIPSIQVAKTLNYSIKDLVMQTEEGRMLSVP